MKPTKERLIDAAAALLDEGGESAVTLRAVGRAVGVSQNAPYRHFEDRSALLAAVAVRDFRAVAESFSAIRQDRVSPLTKLTRALDVFLSYGERFPARYRLLYSDPTIAARRDQLEEAAMASFAEFAAIVQECQAAGELPRTPAADLAGLIFASAHGLVDLEAGGRMRAEKGLNDAAQGVNLLIKVLSQDQPPEPAGPDQSLGWSDARSLICSRRVAEVANAWESCSTG